MKALYKALADFQQEVPEIYKNSDGYNYKFADLGEINRVIKPILKKNGLGYVQPIDGSSIRTIIFHAVSGESIESAADIPQGVKLNGQNDFQVLGSAITYLRRYSLSSMLGLITDADADAAGEQVHEAPVDTLALAKSDILKELVSMHYITESSQKQFIYQVLNKQKIDTIEEARLVADAIDNEKGQE